MLRANEYLLFPFGSWSPADGFSWTVKTNKAARRFRIGFPIFTAGLQFDVYGIIDGQEYLLGSTGVQGSSASVLIDSAPQEMRVDLVFGGGAAFFAVVAMTAD